jgi:hypothetical protein
VYKLFQQTQDEKKVRFKLAAKEKKTEKVRVIFVNNSDINKKKVTSYR